MKSVIEDNREKEKILERILSSEGFVKSEKHCDLLKYLYNAYIEGKVLKETIIALEFFGRNSDFTPSEDPIVRVYVGNIRKKINYFYLTEGRDEKVRLIIPKGHYDISFVGKTKDSISISLSRLQKITFPSLILFLLGLIVAVFYLYVDRKRLTEQIEVVPKSNPIWYEFLNEKKPVLIVMGDYFFMAENRKGNSYKSYLRITDINSIDDYNDTIMNNPELKAILEPLNFTYLRPSISYSLLEILPILSESTNEITLKLASEVIWSDFDSYNVIYIGSFKTTYILNELLKNNNIEYSIRPSRISILDNNNALKTFIAELPDQGQKQKDYGSIIKIKGSSGNVVLFMLGFDELGIQASTMKTADPGFIDVLEEKFTETQIQSPFYFKLVFEIQGYRRTNLDSEIKYFENILVNEE